MSFATLNGFNVSRAEILLPVHGVWFADVWLDTPENITGRVPIVLGNLTLSGTVYRGGAYKGLGQYRLVGGAGGWQTVTTAKQFRHDVGVKVSTILADTAKRVGETIAAGQPDRSVGTHFIREHGTASRVFGQLGINFWVRPDGVTEHGTRSGSAIPSTFEVPSVDLVNRSAVIATETPANILPASSIDVGASASFTISTVLHKVTKESFRTEVFW